MGARAPSCLLVAVVTGLVWAAPAATTAMVSNHFVIVFFVVVFCEVEFALFAHTHYRAANLL